MPPEACALCGLKKDLRESHLIPRKVYVYLRGANRQSDPVLVTAGRMKPVQSQVKQFLLCSDCELLFSENGERSVLALMALPKRFRLYELLSASKPARLLPIPSQNGSSSISIYNGLKTLGAEELNNLVYFGASVFWRASIATWLVPDTNEKVRIELGPYQEGFRRFLLLGDPFPDYAALTVSAATGVPTNQMALMFAPKLEEKGKFHSFAFYIPGIEFILHVGNRVTAEFKSAWDLATGPHHPILLSPLLPQRAFNTAAGLRHKAQFR